MCQEIGQHIEDLRPQREAFSSPAQFIELGVEAIDAKEVAHEPVSSLLLLTPPQRSPSRRE
jgi:hypothetical protein